MRYDYYTFKDIDHIYQAIKIAAEGCRVFEGY